MFVFHLAESVKHTTAAKNPLIATFACVEHSAALIGTPQLLRIVPDLLPATAVASLPDGRLASHVLLGQGLHLRTLRPQRRGEVGRLRSSHDDLDCLICAMECGQSCVASGRKEHAEIRTFALCAALFACQHGLVTVGVGLEQIAALVAEDQGPDPDHLDDFVEGTNH